MVTTSSCSPWYPHDARRPGCTGRAGSAGPGSFPGPCVFYLPAEAHHVNHQTPQDAQDGVFLRQPLPQDSGKKKRPHGDMEPQGRQGRPDEKRAAYQSTFRGRRHRRRASRRDGALTSYLHARQRSWAWWTRPRASCSSRPSTRTQRQRGQVSARVTASAPRASIVRPSSPSGSPRRAAPARGRRRGGRPRPRSSRHPTGRAGRFRQSPS